MHSVKTGKLDYPKLVRLLRRQLLLFLKPGEKPSVRRSMRYLEFLGDLADVIPIASKLKSASLTGQHLALFELLARNVDGMFFACGWFPLGTRLPGRFGF